MRAQGISTVGFLLVLVSALLTAAANLLLRRGVLNVGLAGQPPRMRTYLQLMLDPAFITGVILYGLAAVVWFRVLASEKITTSYPILVGLTFVLVSVGAVLAFRETVSILKLTGMGVILVGVALISKS